MITLEMERKKERHMYKCTVNIETVNNQNNYVREYNSIYFSSSANNSTIISHYDQQPP